MKRELFTLFMFTFFLSACDFNQDNVDHEYAHEKNEDLHEGTTKENDAEFAISAISSGFMEVELGRLALKKAETQLVKDFGQTMISAHTTANEELIALAKAKNIALPVTMSDKHKNIVNRLTAEEKDDFDESYIDLMVSDHKDDIEIFKKQVEHGGDEDIKSWAQRKVSVLEQHLQMAKQVRASLDEHDN